VVTNCSEVLGQAAATHVGVPFNVVVTCERAGYYKPDPRPYQLALKELDLPVDRVLYVSGSAFDLIGCTAVGMDAYWHNRLGHERASDCPAPLVESRTLAQLSELALTPLRA
jgi:FMN phosphatase YigB (HAD superfamily)